MKIDWNNKEELNKYYRDLYHKYKENVNIRRKEIYSKKYNIDWDKDFKICAYCNNKFYRKDFKFAFNRMITCGSDKCKKEKFKEYKLEYDQKFRDSKKEGYSKDNHCIICGKLITNKSIKCQSCGTKTRKRTYKAWNNGLTKETDGRVRISGEKGSKTKKRLFKEGILKPSCGMLGKKAWNTGLTRETDERIKKCAEKMMGEKNPSYVHGRSNEPYDINFNKRFKKYIKERDHYICILCDLFENDCLKLYKKRLSIHHIDYDKKNTFPQNCCLLCTRCNALINKKEDREIWTKHFHELLKKVYGYEYTQDQRIILDFTKKPKDLNT